MDDPLLDMATHDVDDILHQVGERLAHRLAGVFNPQTVERCVVESYFDLYKGARIRLHLPGLAENFACERLTALAQVQGRMDKAVPEVLFLCAYNAGRSQIAASLTDRYATGRVHVRCAGSYPADWLDLTVLEALGEWGIEVEQLYPKPLTDDVLRAADVIVTMGCGEACPVLSGKRYLDRDIPDPAGKTLPKVRAIRDDIDARVRALIDELTTTSSGDRQTMTDSPTKPTVLFVCVHNAGRSQMAAGWLRHLAGDAVEVRSAGSEPANQINPIAVEAMREVNIDITQAVPRKLDYELAEGSDVVVTMGCGDACPYFPGTRYEDWRLTDPDGQPIDVVRQVRDEIRDRVQALVAELLPTGV